ncbi:MULTISPECIES: efflux RND transporter periplasmic adaptor subunit [Clostridium]|uniref:efflux RND transporter periplasmic adaptor subunit n=1 Tax=Clostridium TaxID=1485 RepID=UPI0008258E71|nr:MULTISPECIES: HlyD family efflux transporter periplasmic adaptor subunit [Clostridium]PJI08537.1 HlyD family secretion protein [Clostridium sp. CT7]
MKKVKTITVLALAGLMIFAAGCGSTAKKTQTKKATTKVKNTVDASGTIQSSNVENIIIDSTAAQAIVKVKNVDVKEGQIVKKNDTLVEMDGYNSNKDESYISGQNIISDMDNAVVTNISYQKGDILTAEKKVLELQDLNSLYVKAKVGEEFIKDVQVGKTVTITPAYDTSVKLTGKVTRIGNEVLSNDSTTAGVQSSSSSGESSVPVDISIDNNNGKLFPNYNVDVEIQK